ncbi:Tyrosinase-like protein orsC [Colletotrichum trifolii]|uniref:Tyrosinase-like protein orsC n=1 Tax=Colletotrichum trifolii TaxID=5466 RepID=A0A4R8RQB9_COLTR|nr:Tyrosinase-like protein orsC [Colletotrichum trifolii]
MFASFRTLFLLVLLRPTAALPAGGHLLRRQQENSTCENPLVRREWRSLSLDDRKSYIDAVKCLYGKPAVTPKDILPGASSMYDDFVGDHVLQADANHFVGHFYAWHRLIVWAYETELRNCGYAGAQPYWDWSLDANSVEDMLASPVFDPESGFGGNGEWVPGTPEDPEPGVDLTVSGELLALDWTNRTGGGCIPNGPFANLTIRLGPEDDVEGNERCVRRDFTPVHFFSSANADSVADAMAQPDFWHFSERTQVTIHAAGHAGIGGIYGTLTDVWSSPGDPLFWLHHTNMDRAWWSWQMKNISERLQDMTGPIVPYDYTNALGGNVTLDFEVRTNSSVNVALPIRDLMDIGGGFLCYDYDTLY